MHRQNPLVLYLVILLLTTAFVPVAFGADSGYSISLDDSIDTPSREVSIGGEQHTVSAVGRTTPDSTLSVAVDAPADTAYDVLLYNGDRQIVASKEASGEDSVAFDMAGYAPGSYLLTIYKDGDYKDVFPVVVRGYTTTVDTPSRAAIGSEVTVSVTAEQTETVEDPSAVKIVLVNDEQTVRKTAEKEASQQYRATVSLDQFQVGEIRIYAVVQGSDDAFKDGRKELLGVSDASTLTIYQETTRTTSSTGSSGTTATATTTSSTTVTTVNSTTVTTTSPTTLSPTTSSMKTSSQSLSTTTQHSTQSTLLTRTTDSSVITPAQSATSTSQPSDQGIPGFGIGGSLVALCCLLILALRR